ncbi:hypothetical protein QTH97_33485 [Variovorax sp. J22R24]|uniref:DUF6603 domain-containing protein n=1 Tax=Variovorax gracilis TaxID=3053502 RepID=UPI002574C8E0|nr:DUF6603 domain-containing protein [Variovorax sp. J22R24]MDM0109867.1 hypothetical protein [Variovorax sp. J22R24]
MPGLAELALNLDTLVNEGIHGGVDLGPVHLEVGSSVLVIAPPPSAGALESVIIGPYGVGQIAASLKSPLGGDTAMPGGGSLVRLPGNGGFGGTLQLPLGPVQISATAIVAVIDGDPSFLAIMGVEFLPPIQLSFGFSLDRVGGLVGVNRRADTEALRAAQRTGAAGDVLFAIRPPANALALVTDANRLFPFNRGTHLVGPSLKLSWLSFGPEGSLIGLDLAVIVELPTGKVVILGVARASIPGIPMILDLRLDVLGIVDAVEQLASVDASLVDSHVLGVFEVYGDAAMRLSWGSVGYMIATVGGFYPGFNPEPARLPALRRVGMAMDTPLPIIEVRAEGYFAVTSNSIQLGGRWEVGIALGIEAHGFVQVDAIVLFRPFHFEARIAAGFDVSAGGFSFASVTLEGSVAGPGPIVIHGSLSIDVFLFSISWSETFTLGSGPSDMLPAAPLLIDVVAEELRKPENVHSGSIADPLVVLKPRPRAGNVAAVPPTGTLQVQQRRAPVGFVIERVDGRPLASPQGVTISGGTSDVTDRFSPGSYVTLTDAEALNRPPFDVLACGRVLSLVDPALGAGKIVDGRQVKQIVIVGQVLQPDPDDLPAVWADLAAAVTLVAASQRPPALSDATPLVIATQEVWRATTTGAPFASATAAHQFVRYSKGIAQPAADAAAPLNLAGV